MNYRHLRLGQAGFSYMGLLILVAIIGAVAAGSLSAGATMQRHAAEDELLFVGAQFQVAFKTFYDSTPAGTHPYPRQLNDLVRDPRFSATRRHLRKVFDDPLTGKAEWGVVNAPGGGIMCVYSLSLEAPIRRASFASAFAGLEGKDNYSEWVFGCAPAPG